MNVVAAVAVAAVVATTVRAPRVALAVVVALLALTWVRANDFAEAVAQEHVALRCAVRDGDAVLVARVSHDGVGALVADWDATPAVRLTFDDPRAHAVLRGPATC